MQLKQCKRIKALVERFLFVRMLSAPDRIFHNEKPIYKLMPQDHAYIISLTLLIQMLWDRIFLLKNTIIES